MMCARHLYLCECRNQFTWTIDVPNMTLLDVKIVPCFNFEAAHEFNHHRVIVCGIVAGDVANLQVWEVRTRYMQTQPQYINELPYVRPQGIGRSWIGPGLIDCCCELCLCVWNRVVHVQVSTFRWIVPRSSGPWRRNTHLYSMLATHHKSN